MKKVISIILMSLGCVLIFICIYSVIKNKIEDHNALNKSEKIMEQFEQSEVIKDEKSNINVKNIDGNKYIGTIIIPRLDLNLPINTTCNYDTLKQSPCLYYGSFATNDAVVAAHGYKTFFKYIYKLNKEDIIIIKDVLNNYITYEVDVVEKIKEEDVLEMIENEFDLTLFTCTQDGNSRYAVRCNRID